MGDRCRRRGRARSGAAFAQSSLLQGKDGAGEGPAEGGGGCPVVAAPHGEERRGGKASEVNGTNGKRDRLPVFAQGLSCGMDSSWAVLGLPIRLYECGRYQSTCPVADLGRQIWAGTAGMRKKKNQY